MSVTGRIDLQTLSRLVRDDEIDTVVVAFVDLQGRLLGKRVTGRFFLDHVVGTDGTDGEGIEACNYLLTVDVDMNVLEGFRYATWDGGYGDFRGRPDLTTLRVTPWLERTALVLCDIVDHHGEPVTVSPRQVLQRQLDRAAERGLTVKFGSELEFFAYDRPFDELARTSYRDLAEHTSSWYNLDYHIFQTTKDEPLVRAIRNGMVDAGLPVEFSKGEAAPGQHELNLRYSDALEHGGPPHRLQERRQGDRPPAGQGADVHGEAVDGPARVELSHPLLDLEPRGRPSAVPQRGRPDAR